jgi:hypothetical protein
VGFGLGLGLGGCFVHTLASASLRRFTYRYLDSGRVYCVSSVWMCRDLVYLSFPVCTFFPQPASSWKANSKTAKDFGYNREHIRVC